VNGSDLLTFRAWSFIANYPIKEWRCPVAARDKYKYHAR